MDRRLTRLPPGPPAMGTQQPVNPFLIPTHPMNRGLVAYWMMGDGGQLGKIRDIGQSALDATMHSFAANPRVASHHGGTALNFSAAPWAQASYDANTNCTKGLTLSAWVFRATANDRIVFGKPFNTTDTTPFWDYSLRYIGGAGIQITIGSTSVNITENTTNVWQHWVATADGVNIKIYRNGAVIKTQASATLPTNTNSQGVLIGSNASQLELWSGRQEGLRLYNRCLNASEIARLYAEPYAGIADVRSIRPRVGVVAAAASTDVIPLWQNIGFGPTGYGLGAS